MNRGSLRGHFLGESGRRAFVLMREPAPALRNGGSVLVVPPFGEEMNKSRRMIAETSQRLCEAGMAVALPDLFGTGDSEGEFRDATVERWIDDLAMASRHAEACGWPVRAVLAVRLGCALAVAAARAGAVPAVSASLWWQPVLDGKRQLAQFLRLRVAARSMRGDDPETVDGLRSRSAAGETLAVAGYELSPALVRGLESLVTDALPPQAGALHWLEFVRDEQTAPPLPATRFVERARATGANASLTTCAAEPFWASAEIVRVPRAIERTSVILGGLPLASPGSPSTGSLVGR